SSFPHPPTSQPSPLSLHDALPISTDRSAGRLRRGARARRACSGNRSLGAASIASSAFIRGVRRAALGKVGRTRRAAVLDRSRRRSEEHTSELQSLAYLVCRLLLEK